MDHHRRQRATSANHAVLIPIPTAGHINPSLKLARVLHSHGFHITFFITEKVRSLQLAASAAAAGESCPPPSLRPLGRFRLEVVSDGLPPRCSSGPQHLRDLAVALGTTFIDEVRGRLRDLIACEDEVPPVTCVIAGLLGQALQLAEEIGVPGFLFWTTSACGFLPTLYARELVARGCVAPRAPSGDGCCTAVGAHLDRVVDWIPGLRSLRVRDMSSNFTAVDPDDTLLKFEIEAASWGSRASGGVILNTLGGLENGAVEAMRPLFKKLYVVGPLSAVLDGLSGGGGVPMSAAPTVGTISFWRDDRRYLSWLDAQAAGSVLYISFGSIATMGPSQLSELMIGVVRSGVPFLWIARPDIIGSEEIDGGEAIVAPNGMLQLLPAEVRDAAYRRGYLAEWCSQEEVLAHPSVGGFLTHAGWNSMSESIRRGVPMLCRPFIFDQHVNCRYACEEWCVAMELEVEASAHRVASLVRELMFGPKGETVRENLDRWKKTVCEHAVKGGPSHQDMEALIDACSMAARQT